MAQQPLKCLITGGNSGLGFEVAKQLLLKGHQVMLACRSAQKGQQAVQKLQQQQQQQQQSGLPQGAFAAAAAGDVDASHNPSTATTSSSKSVTSTAVSAVECDLSSLSSVRRCAAAVKQQWPAFDVLVCNAAVIPSQHSITADGIEQQLQVNHLSHMLLVDLLLPCLVAAADARTAASQQQQQGGVVASSRVVVVGSTQHMSVPEEVQKLEVLLPGGLEQQQQQQQQVAVLPPMKLYALTKLCNMWFTRYLAGHVLSATGGRVVANVVSPGFIPSTGLGRHVAGNFLSRFVMNFIMPWAPFAVTPEEGGRRVVSVCTEEEGGRVSGQFFSKGVIAQASPAAQDDAKAAACWAISCKALGLNEDVYGGIKVQ